MPKCCWVFCCMKAKQRWHKCGHMKPTRLSNHFRGHSNPRPLVRTWDQVLVRSTGSGLPQPGFLSVLLCFSLSKNIKIKKKEPTQRDWRRVGREKRLTNSLSLTLETGAITTAYTPPLPFRAETINPCLTLQQPVCLGCFSNHAFWMPRRDRSETDGRVLSRREAVVL